MKQYHDHLKAILEKGSYKEPAREGMPGTMSLFGYQNRYNLQEGFPILTTKEVNFKNIVTELLWFLRRDTNIKYLLDNGCNIWNEDAYNYFMKLGREQMRDRGFEGISFERFIQLIKEDKTDVSESMPYLEATGSYKLGDCGFQYGKVWRQYGKDFSIYKGWTGIDQLAKVIQNIKTKPYDRRKVITAIDPIHDEDLALYWCHSLFQFNCRKLTDQERQIHYKLKIGIDVNSANVYINDIENEGIPKYHLDCHMYQRSADMFLGVPYNISSYALLTHIIAKICNMVPGEFIHSFGDSHIYDNHKEQVTELLLRSTDKFKLPELIIKDEGNDWAFVRNRNDFTALLPSDFELKGYESYPAIKAKLSTGLK